MTEENPMAKSAESAVNFEKSLSSLEALIKEMESGSLSLEKSIDCFERGMALSQHCQKMLQEAEQKVEILTGAGKSAALQPYSECGKDESKLKDDAD